MNCVTIFCVKRIKGFPSIQYVDNHWRCRIIRIDSSTYRCYRACTKNQGSCSGLHRNPEYLYNAYTESKKKQIDRWCCVVSCKARVHLDSDFIAQVRVDMLMNKIEENL